MTVIGTDRPGCYAWTAQQPPPEQDWLHELGADEAAELERALRHLLATGRSDLDTTRDDFPLPTLGPRLRRIMAGLESGPGFAVVRGFPVEHLTEAEVRRLYWGVGLHMGVALAQTYEGQMIADVRDHGGGSDAARRGYGSTADIQFHVDSCDVVGLLCRRTAKEGGESLLCSSLAVRDEVARTRPDLLEVLYEPLPYIKVGVRGPDERPFWLCPVFGERDGCFTSRFFRARMLATQEMEGAPRLTRRQIEAIDMVEEVSKRTSIWLDFRVGDLQLVNNHVVYHARTGFDDWPEQDRKRHLLRLWLASPEGRPLPESFADVWKVVESATVRGGVSAFEVGEELAAYQRRCAGVFGMRSGLDAPAPGAA